MRLRYAPDEIFATSLGFCFMKKWDRHTRLADRVIGDGERKDETTFPLRLGADSL